MRILQLFLLFLLVLGVSSCKHDVPQPVVPVTDNGGTGGGGGGGGGTPCDPNVIYFNRDIQPLLISYCAKPNQGCHDANDAADGVILTSYQTVMNSGVVDPYDLSEDLYEAITDSDPDKTMPRPGYPDLNQQQIDLIAAWIMQGAQNLTCNNGCDTTNVTFSGTIKSIIDINCKGCHSGANPNGGVSLTTYAEVATVAFSGQLTGVINGTSGFPKMPPSGPGLDNCQIDQIEKWVNDGSLNN